ncbi:putative amino acid/polyamine transporter I, amino acid permease/ SLC12A domain-containing protein [Rosa chinensis]|uniref:Putative amino acid/polyamine transporter I, amino acid permease/ SLC12A domain-containing protein n=1 Tax=Rosa chinensis TaxID=74649 RepID=A0A2P6PXH2_ROSCH|nr:putative amino acid/polyamine transporter I, amino acid permease/ SLC12A domain-containing protein [Rosa chinensis]
MDQQVLEMDSGEKRLNELGYKQELRREMTLAITFSCMSVFTGTPLYGQSLGYAGPATLIWGWLVVTFFTWFVGIAMAEIFSSFPTTGSLYFWAAHLAGPRWGPFASWCCAWLEAIGLISAIGAQAFSGSQTLQMIILIATGNNKGGGYFASKGVFLCMYLGLIIIWAILNSFALQVIAILNIISIWWQSTGISSIPYAVILSVLLSNYCLYGCDAAAHLREETKGADRTGPIAILSSIGIVSVVSWAYYLALTFSIRIIYDAFHGRYQNSTGAVVFLCIIWGSFFFCGLSVVYAISRDKCIPFSPIWRKVNPRNKVPTNAVWLCATIGMLLGLPILKIEAVITAIVSISTIGWVGGYAVPIFARLVMAEENFKPGPFYLGRASRPVCLVAFLWICYTCSVFLLPVNYLPS